MEYCCIIVVLLSYLNVNYKLIKGTDSTYNSFFGISFHYFAALLLLCSIVSNPLICTYSFLSEEVNLLCEIQEESESDNNEEQEDKNEVEEKKYLPANYAFSHRIQSTYSMNDALSKAYHHFIIDDIVLDVTLPPPEYLTI